MKFVTQKFIECINVASYISYNMIALFAMLMVADVFAVCGPEETSIRVYQMVNVMPQAFMMIAAPFLCYITYAEPISNRWKLIKYATIGVLFVVSMLTTLKFGLPLLEVEYGSAEVRLWLLPAATCASILAGILKLMGASEEEGYA